MRSASLVLVAYGLMLVLGVVWAALPIPVLGDTGIATLRKQSRVVLDTPEGVGVYLGGTGLSLQGTGILNVSGGSSITINAAPGNARFIAGYDGTGIASFDNSTLSMADGRLSVASQPGSAGILRLSNGSVVTTGWAGVGRDREDLVFEVEPMNRLVRDKQLMIYKHDGFWQPMDTLRDYKLLNKLVQDGKAPWVKW